LRATLLALLLLALLLPRAASAIESVAVLDLDGYGVSWDTTQIMTQGLRDGFLEEATFDPLSGFNISEGLSVGQGETVRLAREQLAEARQRMERGDMSGALRQFAEVLSLHEKAWSWVARRPELADAHYFTAIALSRLGRNSEAVDHMVECLYLYPGYNESRAVSPPSNAASLFGAARARLDQDERRAMPGTRIAAISEQLQARYVVTGYVVADGQVHASLHQDGRLVAEASATAEQLPLSPGDPFFYDLAVNLVGGEHSTTAGSASFPIGSPGSSEELGDFHDIPVVEVPPEAATSAASIGSSDGGHLTDQGSAYSANKRTRRESSHKIKGVRYERKPVAETWWFWTGVTALVAGGGVGLYFLLREDTPTTEAPVEQDSYTVRVDPGALVAE
jgi:hypothetical protein